MRAQITMAHIPDPTTFHASHKRLVTILAGQWSSQHGLDISDLESVGNEVMWNCMRKWDPDRGKFTTLLHWSLNSAFINLVKKESREPCSAINCPIDEDTRKSKNLKLNPFIPGINAPFHDPFWFHDLIIGLSKDAVEIVEVLLTNDLGDMVSDHPRFVRAALKKVLITELGWDQGRQYLVTHILKVAEGHHGLAQSHGITQ